MAGDCDVEEAIDLAKRQERLRRRSERWNVTVGSRCLELSGYIMRINLDDG
jgi:hypothetical protein